MNSIVYYQKNKVSLRKHIKICRCIKESKYNFCIDHKKANLSKIYNIVKNL